jgi:hypothetical protein
MSKKNQKQEQQETPPPETGIEPLSGSRQKGESDNAVVACNDWLRMGSGRSLPALLEHYTEAYYAKPPTTSYATLKIWSMNYSWTERATQFDATWEARKNAERDAVLNYGLAHDYERVRKLYRLAAFLEAQIYELSAPDEVDGMRTYLNVWVRDVKGIGSGEFAKQIELERFNAPLFEQYRKVLEDIAKETGGRVTKTDVTSGGEQIAIAVIKMDVDEL